MKEGLENRIESMKSMMKSIFAYDGLHRSGYSFDQYLKKYEDILGKQLFDEVYDEYSKYLNDTFEVVRNVYTDHEGCTYNSLVKINEDGE